MSNKVWIFGDSFQDSNYPKGQNKSWCDILFESKGYEVKNFSVAGVSTESIVLLCLDYLDEISVDDFVLVNLSSGLRFMAPSGNGSVRDTIFDRYKESDIGSHHPNVWEHIYDSKTETGKKLLLTTFAQEFHTGTGDKLKHSVWNNYISIMLERKGCKFKIVYGHYEPKQCKSQISNTYMYDVINRTIHPSITNYYDLTNSMSFPSGMCLINDFFDVSIRHLMSKFGEQRVYQCLDKMYQSLVKRLEKNKGRYGENVQNVWLKSIEKEFGKENNIFFDPWHLNPHGQEIYASYAKDYDWGI